MYKIILDLIVHFDTKNVIIWKSFIPAFVVDFKINICYSLKMTPEEIFVGQKIKV